MEGKRAQFAEVWDNLEIGIKTSTFHSKCGSKGFMFKRNNNRRHKLEESKAGNDKGAPAEKAKALH